MINKSVAHMVQIFSDKLIVAMNGNAKDISLIKLWLFIMDQFLNVRSQF